MPRIRLGRVASLALSLLIGPALLVALSFVLAQPARAAAYVVTNTNDSGPGSLREAILNANASAGADVITFDLSGCPCSIGLASTLTVNNALTIYGPGASQLALDGGSAVQVIATTNVPVSISDLTIRNGLAAYTGGGIIASGALTLTQAFERLAQKVNALPEGPAKAMATTAVQGLKTEAEKGEAAEEKNVQQWFGFLAQMAPDILEVAAATFVNPIAGLGVAFKKIAEKAKG
jgi:hypothetical protein